MEKYCKIVLCYYLIINILLFILMGIDKHRAEKGKWRIRENTLFAVAFIGGFAGGFAGMRLFRHKTRKLKFYVIYSLAMLLHLFLMCYIYIMVFF